MPTTMRKATVSDERFSHHALGSARRYGWCLTHDCDTATGRGGCPIQVSNLAPCGCSCHEGQTSGRGYMAKIPVVVSGAETVGDSLFTL